MGVRTVWLSASGVEARSPPPVVTEQDQGRCVEQSPGLGRHDSNTGLQLHLLLTWCLGLSRGNGQFGKAAWGVSWAKRESLTLVNPSESLSGGGK